MTGKNISVRAQWALHGKVLDDEGYQVIACSHGDLSRANFADALGRFTLGALDTLPQVSVSYLQPATSSPGGGYLALAIHWFAADGQRYADGVLRFDNQGRHTAFTSYFCAPYAQLAQQGITYLDMYTALSGVTLPTKDGPPKEVTITAATQQVPAIDGLAMRVAPLLLTGVPVCVLGADETSMDERLRFIDAVMGLLPYGFRAKMTAATWTRATNRNHRFRLFFSSAPRASERPDHLVSWGSPEQVKIPSKAAWHYYQWLDDKVAPLAGLAQLNGEIGFGESADRQALNLVDKAPPARRSRQEPVAADAQGSPGKHSPTHAKPAPENADPVTKILAECSEHVRILNLTRLRQDLSRLQDQLGSGWIDEDHRNRYRMLITKFGLLRHNPGLQRYEVKLYETLLPLAFGRPVTYEAFCQVEDCLGNRPDGSIHSQLLEAIDRAGLADARVKVMVHSSLDRRKLDKWLGSKDADAYGLIGELARGAWHRQQHGRLFCDVTLRYLDDKRGRYSTLELQKVLFRNGYLAQRLREIGSDQYQVHAITKLLLAAFPKETHPYGLEGTTVTKILGDAQDAPTPALLAAVLWRIPVAAKARAWDAYVYGTVTRLNLNENTHGALWTKLPVIERVRAAQPQRPPQDPSVLAPLMDQPPMESLPAELPPGQEPQWQEQRQGSWSWPGQGQEQWQEQGPGSWPGSETAEMDVPNWLNAEPRSRDDL